MTISAIWAAGLGQSVVASSNSTQVQRILQKLNSDLTNASGNSSANSTQLFSDLSALGRALGSGDLASAQSAFAAIQKELESAGSPSLAIEASAASASVQLVEGLLSLLNTSNGSTDTTTSLLSDVYGGSLDIHT